MQIVIKIPWLGDTLDTPQCFTFLQKSQCSKWMYYIHHCKKRVKQIIKNYNNYLLASLRLLHHRRPIRRPSNRSHRCCCHKWRCCYCTEEQLTWLLVVVWRVTEPLQTAVLDPNSAVDYLQHLAQALEVLAASVTSLPETQPDIRPKLVCRWSLQLQYACVTYIYCTAACWRMILMQQFYLSITCWYCTKTS